MPASKRTFPIAAAQAENLWDLYGFRSPRELVLEDLAFAQGILVVEAPLDSADARLVRRKARGLIRVNSAIPERGRKRFAIAHELGHWVLHARLTQILACTNEDMLSAYRASEPELEASCFASSLLMPRSLFLPRIEATQPTYELLSDLANEFDSSLTATAVRYIDLRDDYCALIVSQAGKVRWWRDSRDFAGKFWIEPGSPLPARSAAAAICRGAANLVGPDELALSDWLPEVEGLPDTVVEQAILLPRYDQILSLLWLP